MCLSVGSQTCRSELVGRDPCELLARGFEQEGGLSQMKSGSYAQVSIYVFSLVILVEIYGDCLSRPIVLEHL